MKKEELEKITGGMSETQLKAIHFPPEVTSKIRKSVNSVNNGGKTYSLEEIKIRHQRKYFGK
jgi:hypothetical protein